MDLTESFELGSPDNPPCLFLHGFTGSPAELRPLAERIAREGFRVVGPRLPGHGLGAPDLATAGAHDWMRCATDALQSLGKPAHVAGLSMGALLAVQLAATEPRAVQSLALLAPAVRLKGLARPAAWVLRRVPALYRRWPSIPVPVTSDVRDPTLAGVNPKNPRLSLLGMAELSRLQARVFKDARRVTAPALVVIGKLDRTICNFAARRLARALEAEIGIAPRSGHQLGLDHDREAVAAHLLALFRRAAQ